ncbi:MAG: hypothetical protein KAU46_00585 [Candidatus Aminicenantes bacterium]|nr:hypothetical protein [Candidatus Aminicenantes bacterium]
MMIKNIFKILFLLAFFIFTVSAREKKETALPVFEQPLLITSAGQSADVYLASILAKKAGLNSSLSKIAAPKDMKNIKTLVLVLGASLKGLGSAGLDKAKEKERVNLLVAKAQKKNIPILCLHLGGEARRGKLSDEFITSFLPFAKMAIVVKSGNKDRLLSRICEERNIPWKEVEKATDALKPFKEAFK